MLFNSFIFIFLFLPISVIVFYLIKKSNYQNLAIIWLIVISLFFYGWWNIKYLALILFSIVLNYSFGLVLKKHNKKIYLILGIFINLFIIGYFKYSNFFLENMNFFFKNQFILNQIILPLNYDSAIPDNIMLNLMSFKFQKKNPLVPTKLSEIYRAFVKAKYHKIITNKIKENLLE